MLPRDNYCEPILTLKYGDSITSDDTAKAICFNNYFSSVFTSEGTTSLTSLQSTLVQNQELITTLNLTLIRCLILLLL